MNTYIFEDKTIDEAKNKDLKELNIIDDIIKEPEGGAQEDFEKVAKDVKKYLLKRK